MPVELNANELLDRLAIRELVDNWLVYRDTQNWEKFLDIWHHGGFTMTTWGGKATPQQFVEAATRGFERGDRMLHSIGGTTVELAGDRAVSQSKFRIMQRGPVDGVLCDVTCIGRNYDFFEKRDGRWGLVVRQPIYERDSIVPVDPNENVTLDPGRLARYPEGYARLAYLQEGLGYPIKADMPVLEGAEVEALVAAGAQWLAGGELAWPPA
jgi:SnoaL-like domain